MTERDYFQELKINKNNLEGEWIEHSERSQYWCVQAAKAQTGLNEIELDRKIVIAGLGRGFRLEMENKEKKPTEKVIEEMIRTTPIYKELTEKLIKAKENSEILDAAKWNFQARKTSLEKIQEGIIMGLFSDPRTSGETSKNEEKMREEIATRRNRK